MLPLQTSPIAGTIFAATTLPLRLRFRAICHLTQSKQGISSIELGRRLGGTQTIGLIWQLERLVKLTYMWTRRCPWP
jgi:hypothetical protein